jgi:hypothetical protein
MACDNSQWHRQTKAYLNCASQSLGDVSALRTFQVRIVGWNRGRRAYTYNVGPGAAPGIQSLLPLSGGNRLPLLYLGRSCSLLSLLPALTHSARIRRQPPVFGGVWVSLWGDAGKHQSLFSRAGYFPGTSFLCKTGARQAQSARLLNAPQYAEDSRTNQSAYPQSTFSHT